MQVIHEPGLEFVRVDTEEVTRILVEQDVSQAIINNLRIYIQTKPSDADREDIYEQDGNHACSGYAISSRNEIYVFTNTYHLSSMNNTLLHELHHIIKQGYRSGEQRLPHDERPSEIAARLFAREQEEKHAVITIPWSMKLKNYMARPADVANSWVVASLTKDAFVIAALAAIIIDMLIRHVK